MSRGGRGGFKSLIFFLVNLNEKWMIPQERASFSKVISLYICIFSIFHDQVIAKIEKIWLLFMGGFSAKFLAYGIFYANQLVSRVKQPYTMSFVEIPVGVVSDRADFTEDPLNLI